MRQARAASEADDKAAYAAAEAASKEAAGMRNQWTGTVSALAAARKAANGGDFDRATAAFKGAEALAKASIFQGTLRKRSLDGDENPLDCPVNAVPTRGAENSVWRSAAAIS